MNLDKRIKGATRRAANRVKILRTACRINSAMQFFSKSIAHNAMLGIVIGNDWGKPQPIARIHGEMAVFCSASKTNHIISDACEAGYLYKHKAKDDRRSVLIGATDLLLGEHLKMVDALYEDVPEEEEASVPLMLVEGGNGWS